MSLRAQRNYIKRIIINPTALSPPSSSPSTAPTKVVNQSRTRLRSIIETPTRFRPTIEKLSTNISLLQNKYQDLIKKTFYKKDEMKSYKMRFLKLKKDEEEKKKIKMKQDYISLKKIKLKKEHEKNQKIKEEIKENKIKENDKIKEKVQKLKDKQINDLNILKKNLKSNQENKKRKKEEEKNYIKNELSLQKDKNKKELEKKKLINLQKNQNKAERIQGNEVYLLQKIKNDLESKIKVQETIYNKMNKQYYDYVQTTINDEYILNSL